MLKLNPFERLGAGNEEEKLDIESLKSHCFFTGINFNSFLLSESPLLKVFDELEHVTIDFEDSDDDDNWLSDFFTAQEEDG